MKFLIIGDLHGRSYKKYLKNIEQYDKVIFLGDYVDSFYKSNIDIIKNLEELIQFKKLNKNKVELLIGNHDFQYIGCLKNREQCSGYRQNYAAILYDLFNKNIDLFRVAYQYRNYLFTHAGLTKQYFEQIQSSDLKEVIDFNITKNNSYANILNNCFKFNPHVLWSIGYERGGFEYGSCLWADITEFLDIKDGKYIKKISSDKVIKGLNCIQGHQPVKEIIVLENGEDKYIWCDCDSYEIEDNNGNYKKVSIDDGFIELEIE